jgi:hypothetical protein
LSTLAFPKPGQIKKRTPAVERIDDPTAPDGYRQVCNMKTAAGREIYKVRTLDMRDRQDERCALRGMFMPLWDVTFDHKEGRGSGGSRTDDRIFDDKGNWLNQAVHWRCNSEKGSRRISTL